MRPWTDSDLSLLHTELLMLQNHVSAWADYNFGSVPSWQPLLGVGEEVGELNHAHLKQAQKIRGYTDEVALAAKKDAIGDIIIFLANYCGRENIDLGECVETAWKEVRQRDFVQWPLTGRPPTEERS